VTIEFDERTVFAAVAGDADALRSLLQACAPRLREHFTGRIGRRYQAALDVDDVLQVTYMEACLQIRRFTPAGDDAFYVWLRQIGENNLRDAIRGLEAAKRPDPGRQVSRASAGDSCTTFLATISGSGTTPTFGARRSEAKEALEAALASLPPDYSKAIRLYDLEGRTIDEAAAAFDPPRSRGAVHMLRARAMEALRLLLGNPDHLIPTRA
jgi:RNA polymerase sigma factor (sigma-70 family)